MFKKTCLFTFAIALLPFADVTTAAAQANSSGAKPDILVFLTDDQSQLDTSLYGELGLKTPNLEKLAEHGMTFSHAYVASPSCAPSRASLLTGLMPARTGAEPNHARPHADIKKWPAYFQELGYEVHAFGKISHYKHTEMYGFDSFAHDTFHDHAAIPAANEFLKTRKRLQTSGSTTASKPLCLMVGTNWPHVPWPKDFEGIDAEALTLPPLSVDTPLTREARGKFAAAVRNADDDLGAVLRTAKDTLSTNTIVLFSSDHGTQWPFGKWNLYEAGIRVPLVVCWPEKIKPGSRSDALVSWIDFLPTLLEAVGGKAPADIDGKSFLAVLTGETTKHRDRIFTTHSGDGHWNVYPIRSVTDGRYKYIRNLHPEYAFTTHIDIPGELGRTNYWDTWEEVATGAGMRLPLAAPKSAPATKDQKSGEFATHVVSRYYARPAEEFYDLSVDPNELNNLAQDSAHAERIAAMRQQVDQWMAGQGDRKEVYGNPHLLTDVESYGPNARTVGQQGKLEKK